VTSCQPCAPGFTYCKKATGPGITRHEPFCDADADCYGDDDYCKGGHQLSGCVTPAKQCGSKAGRRREELPAIAPGGEKSFQQLYIEFGDDLRPHWCKIYGCEDFDARVAEL